MRELTASAIAERKRDGRSNFEIIVDVLRVKALKHYSRYVMGEFASWWTDKFSEYKLNVSLRSGLTRRALNRQR